MSEKPKEAAATTPAAPSVRTELDEKKTVTVYSKLPWAIEFGVERDTRIIRINGKNRKTSVIEGYGATRLPAGDWNAILAAHPDFPAIKNGSIFMIPSASESEGGNERRDRTKIKTGFEGASQKDKDKEESED